MNSILKIVSLAGICMLSQGCKTTPADAQLESAPNTRRIPTSLSCEKPPGNLSALREAVTIKIDEEKNPPASQKDLVGTATIKPELGSNIRSNWTVEWSKSEKNRLVVSSVAKTFKNSQGEPQNYGNDYTFYLDFKGNSKDVPGAF
ncbi:MAG: hypothetical protein NTV34_21465 [Proteobacteria bacterium]|nr:hypothetical protein [Pseudomonadota bacterium]